MGIFRKSTPKPNNPDPYSDLRRQILDLKPSPELRNAMDSHLVYAAIVDMDMGNAIISLACVADGTTSLYYSTGGGQIGLGHANEAVRNAARAFLFSSEQVLDKLVPTKVYPLPTNDKHIVYLITEKNVYMHEFEMEKLDTTPREIQFLNFLYQNVLSKIGEAKGTQ